MNAARDAILAQCHIAGSQLAAIVEQDSARAVANQAELVLLEDSIAALEAKIEVEQDKQCLQKQEAAARQAVRQERMTEMKARVKQTNVRVVLL